MRVRKSTSSSLLRPAFTLMEMMVVVAIIVILGGIAVVAYTQFGERGNEAKVARDIHDLDLAVMTYYTECGFTEWPADLPVLGDPSNKIGRILVKNILDPWGQRYKYDINGTQNALRGEKKPDIWCELPAGDGWVIGNWASGKVRMGG